MDCYPNIYSSGCCKASPNDVLLMFHNCGSPMRDQSRSGVYGVYAPTLYPLPSPQDLYVGKIQDPTHPSYLGFGVFAGAEVSEHQVVGFVVGVCRYVPGLKNAASTYSPRGARVICRVDQ
jgi:hypothetical protein